MTKPLRILVVDDDEDNANSLGELFEMEGHQVLVAHSGEAAVAAYVNGTFDIAFMDVMMPGRNGVESFLDIRKLRPEAKVFMMTGYSVEQLLQQAMENGAMGVLAKPVDLDKLLQAVDKVMPSGIVFIADGDPQFGRQLKSLIETTGMNCDLIHRDDEALDADAAITIIDLGKPLINGVEVYTRFKRAGTVRPAIIITPDGAHSADAFEALRDVAVTGILTKPFDPLSLLDRLNALAA